MVPNMNSNALQQNFILFLEKTKEELQQTLNRRLCCEKCRFSTKDSALFERHVAQHEEVTFSCTICNHVSYSRVESQRHLVKHKGSFPYKCNWCTYGAVRRDYMVKHIQRIHGKSAEGIFMSDYTKNIDGTKGLCLSTPRTLGGPSHDVNDTNHSAANVSSLHCSASQTRPAAPYHLTNTNCTLPIVKYQPYVLPSPTHTERKVTQGIFYPPNVTVDEAGPTVDRTIEYVKKITDKTSLEKSAVTSAHSVVHVDLSGDCRDCTVKQKLPLQSHVVGTTEKSPIQRKIIPKVQLGLPVSNNTRLETLLGNRPEAPVLQKSVISGSAQNIPVPHAVQRSVPSSANPTVYGERFSQGGPSINHRAQTAGKNSQRKTRPNILLRTPPRTVQSSTKPPVQVGFLSPVNQHVEHNKPSISSTEERNPPRSNVQVELLAPLNQPIQHNKPLTVSCPEEITIPAGCLVELVEVKNVNGVRELELRIVPQQLTGLQQGDTKGTAVTSTTSRMSFKCRVATDDNQPINTNHEINSPKANAIPEYPVHKSPVRKLSADDKVNVKNESALNDKVSSRKNGTPAPGSSSKCFQAFPRSVAPSPSESQKFMQKLCARQKSVPGPVKPVSHMPCTVKNISPPASNRNFTSKGLKFELRAAEPSPNKHDAERSYQGLPVISSVFSLCPVPRDALSNIRTNEGEDEVSVISGPQDRIKSMDDPRVCSSTLKTEDETDRMLKPAQLTEKKDEILEVPKAPEDLVKENRDPIGPKTFSDEEEEEDSDIPELSNSSSTNALHTNPSFSMKSSSISKSDCFTEPEIPEKTKLDSENSSVAHTPLASSMNPIVALIRMPSLEFFSLSETATKVPEKQDDEESITVRPVVCCTPNQRNLPDKAIKLVLKRKWSDTNTAQDHITDLVCVDLTPRNKKAKKEKKRAKKHKSSKNQPLLRKDTMGNMYLIPLKDDQLVKLPGPTQPVVVLNHPNPQSHMVSVEGQTLNNQHCRNSTPDLCSQDGGTVAKPVTMCPAFKMTLKKVQGKNYQVTELLLKGV